MKSTAPSLPAGLIAFGMLATAFTAQAQTFNPSYQATFGDATTGDNQFTSGGQQRWTIDPGADSYTDDFYERPTNQTYVNTPHGVATDSDYFGNLDIQEGRLGIDNEYVYVGIKMWDTSLYKSDGGVDQEGLKYLYSFRMGANADGSNGYLFRTDDPASQGTSWHTVKNTGFVDTNGDFPTDGNGYETNYVADGNLISFDQDILWTRINPNDSSMVEFVLDYKAMGFTREEVIDFQYFVFESNKGLLDPANYKWNQEYTASEAGTPYTTAGLGNIYELDTLNGSFSTVPEPSSAALITLGAALGLLRRRRA